MTSANNEATNNFRHTCAVHGSCDVITEIKNKYLSIGYMT